MAVLVTGGAGYNYMLCRFIKAKRLLWWTAERGIDEMCADLWNFARNSSKIFTALKIKTTR